MDMINPIYKEVEKMAIQRGRWIDSIVTKNIPEWKLKFVMKAKSDLIKAVILKVLDINLDITNEQLPAGFGVKVVIKLNGKLIGERKFKY